MVIATIFRQKYLAIPITFSIFVVQKMS